MWFGLKSAGTQDLRIDHHVLHDSCLKTVYHPSTSQYGY